MHAAAIAGAGDLVEGSFFLAEGLAVIGGAGDIDKALGCLEKAYRRAGRRSRKQLEFKRTGAGPRRAD